MSLDLSIYSGYRSIVIRIIFAFSKNYGQDQRDGRQRPSLKRKSLPVNRIQRRVKPFWGAGEENMKKPERHNPTQSDTSVGFQGKNPTLVSGWVKPLIFAV